MSEPRIPERPTIEGLEDKWTQVWQDQQVYAYDRTASRDDTYAIDTPPPTVSGSLHVGHVFSYTHTDVLARFWRMRGKHVFYPMGWDDNGLPTERRVQNYYGVSCDPDLPYDPDFTPPEEPAKPPVHISRRNFIECCTTLTAQDEEAFKALWLHLGLSIDWSLEYSTIGELSRRVSQRAFLRNLARGEAYLREAPTIWDVDFQTAVAQAELEDREVPGATHRLRFAAADADGDREEDLVIETTRPELLPACVAVVVHPEDERYRGWVGRTVRTPIFGVDVEVVTHELADPEKGTGAAMICTFGDTTDVTWWRELGLATRAIVGRNGRLLPVEWGTPGWESADPAAAQEAYDQLAGATIFTAKKRIVELLAASGDLIGEPKPITHAVKFYEKGDRPLEVVTSRQWFLRNGGVDEDLREALQRRGEELRWHPPYMQQRYASWVDGLKGDWLISRQRFFGVPFPVWYPVGEDGELDHDNPILPDEADLPVDPRAEAPRGYAEDQRGEPGGFAADPDVMDTWATSSLSPLIASRWEEEGSVFAQVFPMDLRPQSHEIIRTWLFGTVVRSHLEHDALPWSDTAISGWILDPDRKKMAKSKGNVVTPQHLLEEFGSDAARYWSASGGPGVDTAFDRNKFKIGRRLAVKVLNASRFVMLACDDIGDALSAEVTEPLDASMLASLADTVEEATRQLEEYDYAKALATIERSFWQFCDNHIELVKDRAYGTEQPGEGTPDDPGHATLSARAGLARALDTYVRLLAPYLVFVAEEVWSWYRDDTVHLASWPDPERLRAESGHADAAVADLAGEVIGAIRSWKSAEGIKQRAELADLTVTVGPGQAGLVESVRADLRRAGKVVGGIEIVEDGELAVVGTPAEGEAG